MKSSEMQDILSDAAACWPNFEATQRRRDVWMRLLGHIHANVVAAAIDTHATQCQFPPTPADVLRIIGKLKATVTGEATSPEEAFGLVLTAVRRFGYYQESNALASLPAKVAKAAKMLGWQEICLSENLEALRAHFYRTYKSVEDNQSFTENLPPAVKRGLESPKFVNSLIPYIPEPQQKKSELEPQSDIASKLLDMASQELKQ